MLEGPEVARTHGGESSGREGAEPFRGKRANTAAIPAGRVGDEGTHGTISGAAPLTAVVVEQRGAPPPAGGDIDEEIGGARREEERTGRAAHALHRRQGCLADPEVVLVRDERRPTMLERKNILRREPPQLPFDLPDQHHGKAEPPIAMAEEDDFLRPPLRSGGVLLPTAHPTQGVRPHPLLLDARLLIRPIYRSSPRAATGHTASTRPRR
jgi:hypothetical protein